MTPDELNDKQLIALDLLVAGATQQRAADAAGVTRQTVNEWCTKNPRFISERQTRRMLRSQHQQDRVQALADQALDVFQEQIRKGDPKAATFILRMASSDAYATPAQVEAEPLRTDVREILLARIQQYEERQPPELGPTEPDTSIEARLVETAEKMIEENDAHGIISAQRMSDGLSSGPNPVT